MSNSKRSQSTTISRSSILTIEEVGAALSVSPQDVKKLFRKHKIPLLKVGHKIRVSELDYQTLLEKIKVYYE